MGLFGKKTATLVTSSSNMQKAKEVWGEEIVVNVIGNNKTTETEAEARLRLKREMENIYRNGQSKLRNANFGGQEEM